MPVRKTGAEISGALGRQARELGLELSDERADGFRGSLEAIRSKWWLGGRKVVYSMSVRVAEAEHAVMFREAVSERSWGLPPPTVSFSTRTVSGWERSGTTREVALGGGSLDFARVREAIERLIVESGWEFRLEGGRLP